MMWGIWPATAMPVKPIKHPCNCCGHKTIEKPGEFEFCPVCWWEDDPSQLKDNRPGSNGLSLAQAMANYKKLGAARENRRILVRPPTEDEKAPP